MAIKARKQRSYKTREILPTFGVDAEGYQCVVAVEDGSTEAGAENEGKYFLTRVHPHGLNCGHNHGDPEVFGPYETKKDAQRYAEETLGVKQWSRV